MDLNGVTWVSLMSVNYRLSLISRVTLLLPIEVTAHSVNCFAQSRSQRPQIKPPDATVNSVWDTEACRGLCIGASMKLAAGLGCKYANA